MRVCTINRLCLYHKQYHVSHKKFFILKRLIYYIIGNSSNVSQKVLY